MPVVICNTSPIQYLYQTDMLELLPALAGQVYVPEAVVAELEEGRRRNVLLPVLEDLSWLIGEGKHYFLSRPHVILFRDTTRSTGYGTSIDRA